MRFFMRQGLWLRLGALSTVALLAFAACGEEEPEPQAAPEFTTLEEGVLKVGSCLDYRPFEFFKKGAEEPTGFDVELVNEIAKRLELEVEWVRTSFEGIFEALAAGNFDIVAAASTITPKRAETVDFSSGYYNARQSLTANVNETPDIDSTDDLSSEHTVGVQKGTTGKAWAQDNLTPQGVQIKTYDSVSDAFVELEAGAITGIINDEPSSIGEVAQRPGLEVVQPIDTQERYGFALAKENPELSEAINATLKDIIADGTYADIFKRYFPELPLPEEFQPTE